MDSPRYELNTKRTGFCMARGTSRRRRAAPGPQDNLPELLCAALTLRGRGHVVQVATKTLAVVSYRRRRVRVALLGRANGQSLATWHGTGSRSRSGYMLLSAKR